MVDQNILVHTLENIAEKEKLTNYDIKIVPLSSEGANFTSNIYKAVITSANHEDLLLFAKLACWAKAKREVCEIESIYHIESYFYSNVVPIYEMLQEKYKFPLNERFEVTKYYGSDLKQYEETLVLDNLAEKGYTIYDRLKSMDWEYASNAVQQLARFHALSFAYKHKYPELFENGRQMFSKAIHFYTSFKDVYTKTAENVLKIIPAELKQRFERFFREQLKDEILEKYYGPAKWNVLVHGDYRTSNIMHKTQNGKVTSLIPIDYQTLHLGSPSTDLLYLIYGGTDEQFREKHLEQLKNLYYETLASWLKQMELNPDEVFSRQDFDSDYEHMLPYGLYVSIILLPIFLVNSDGAPKTDVEEADNSAFVIELNEIYKKRFIPILNEFVEKGVI